MIKSVACVLLIAATAKAQRAFGAFCLTDAPIEIQDWDELQDLLNAHLSHLVAEGRNNGHYGHSLVASRHNTVDQWQDAFKAWLKLEPVLRKDTSRDPDKDALIHARTVLKADIPKNLPKPSRATRMYIQFQGAVNNEDKRNRNVNDVNSFIVLADKGSAEPFSIYLSMNRKQAIYHIVGDALQKLTGLQRPMKKSNAAMEISDSLGYVDYLEKELQRRRDLLRKKN